MGEWWHRLCRAILMEGNRPSTFREKLAKPEMWWLFAGAFALGLAMGAQLGRAYYF